MFLAYRNPASTASKEVKEIKSKENTFLDFQKVQTAPLTVYGKKSRLQRKDTIISKKLVKDQEAMVRQSTFHYREESIVELTWQHRQESFNIFTDLDRIAQSNPPNLQIKVSFFRSASCNGSNCDLWKALTKLSKVWQISFNAECKQIYENKYEERKKPKYIKSSILNLQLEFTI